MKATAAFQSLSCVLTVQIETHFKALQYGRFIHGKKLTREPHFSPLTSQTDIKTAGQIYDHIMAQR